MAKPEDYAWAAGFIDGEGCFDATCKMRYRTADGVARERRYLRLSVDQKYTPLLDQLASIFGVEKVYPYKARTSSPDGFKWVCNGRVAFAVAALVWPWLGERKKSDFKRALRLVLATRTSFTRTPPRLRRAES